MDGTKQYKAIFFDWDGTAVLSRSAPADEVAAAMKPLLQKGIKLIIVSGTTYDKIAGGNIERFFTEEELENLYLGLGRGAYNYCFEHGKPVVFAHEIPDKDGLLAIHDICYDVHRELFACYGLKTDVVFTRPNYCKIDLMVENDRANALFMQESELDQLRETLKSHGITGGLQSLITLAEEKGNARGRKLCVTCDAKYLEAGVSDKSSNVNVILGKIMQENGISAEECSYWGDEYVGLEEGIFGSDSFMKTHLSERGDFFDVSKVPGKRPEGVKVLGGGVETFLEFLREQNR